MGLKTGYYEMLGVDRAAPPSQIERAYRFAKELYEDDALAAQIVERPDDVARARARLKEAYEVLMDPDRRRAYDDRVALGAPAPLGEEPAPGSRLEAAGRAAEAAVAARTSAAVRTSPSPDPTLDPPKPPICGRSLREYREARGVSLEDIASITKIGARYLEALEADRFGGFPAVFYMKHYLAAYCTTLGLDPRPIVDSYISRIDGH
jgi:curved DNA-binding protein CbpA